MPSRLLQYSAIMQPVTDRFYLNSRGLAPTSHNGRFNSLCGETVFCKILLSPEVSRFPILGIDCTRYDHPMFEIGHTNSQPFMRN